MENEENIELAEKKIKRLLEDFSADAKQLEMNFTRIFSHSSVKVPEPIAKEAFDYLTSKNKLLITENFDTIKKEFSAYLNYFFEKMYDRLKLEGKLEDALSLLAITPADSFIIQEKALEEKKLNKSIESNCSYIARFLENHERVELFEMLLSLLTESKELHFSTILTKQVDSSPEKHLSKIINVSQRVVFKWKNKQTIPNVENTARILMELLKRDPGRVNNRLNLILVSVKERAFEVYTLLNKVSGENQIPMN